LISSVYLIDLWHFVEKLATPENIIHKRLAILAIISFFYTSITTVQRHKYNMASVVGSSRVRDDNSHIGIF
jgi:hypothetical protein